MPSLPPPSARGGPRPPRDEALAASLRRERCATWQRKYVNERQEVFSRHRLAEFSDKQPQDCRSQSTQGTTTYPCDVAADATTSRTAVGSAATATTSRTPRHTRLSAALAAAKARRAAEALANVSEFAPSSSSPRPGSAYIDAAEEARVAEDRKQRLHQQALDDLRARASELRLKVDEMEESLEDDRIAHVAATARRHAMYEAARARFSTEMAETRRRIEIADTERLKLLGEQAESTLATEKTCEKMGFTIEWTRQAVQDERAKLLGSLGLAVEGEQQTLPQKASNLTEIARLESTVRLVSNERSAVVKRRALAEVRWRDLCERALEVSYHQTLEAAESELTSDAHELSQRAEALEAQAASHTETAKAQMESVERIRARTEELELNLEQALQLFLNKSVDDVGTTTAAASGGLSDIISVAAMSGSLAA
eukprot:TRINITY_DN62330_c0_g1_i1.p1 TRINITY_DN62330_c0_g1~~TRINITY_DN62330_c0_g1_i1.p1  ORF type:complete len:455 (+),score=69.95 TRINITY_DN62330_c0_g1_i1:83-1366(+)